VATPTPSLLPHGRLHSFDGLKHLLAAALNFAATVESLGIAGDLLAMAESTAIAYHAYLLFEGKPTVTTDNLRAACANLIAIVPGSDDRLREAHSALTQAVESLISATPKHAAGPQRSDAPHASPEEMDPFIAEPVLAALRPAAEILRNYPNCATATDDELVAIVSQRVDAGILFDLIRSVSRQTFMALQAVNASTSPSFAATALGLLTRAMTGCSGSVDSPVFADLNLSPRDLAIMALRCRQIYIRVARGGPKFEHLRNTRKPAEATGDSAAREDATATPATGAQHTIDNDGFTTKHRRGGRAPRDKTPPPAKLNSINQFDGLGNDDNDDDDKGDDAPNISALRDKHNAARSNSTARGDDDDDDDDNGLNEKRSSSAQRYERNAVRSNSTARDGERKRTPLIRSASGPRASSTKQQRRDPTTSPGSAALSPRASRPISPARIAPTFSPIGTAAALLGSSAPTLLASTAANASATPLVATPATENRDADTRPSDDLALGHGGPPVDASTAHWSAVLDERKRAKTPLKAKDRPGDSALSAAEERAEKAAALDSARKRPGLVRNPLEVAARKKSPVTLAARSLPPSDALAAPPPRSTSGSKRQPTGSALGLARERSPASEANAPVATLDDSASERHLALPHPAPSQHAPKRDGDAAQASSSAAGARSESTSSAVRRESRSKSRLSAGAP